MKKLAAFVLLFGGLVAASAAYAADVNFDGGSGSTLDTPQASQGTEPNQGTFHAEANS